MRVLVTGGTGFTGSHLVRRMLDRGYQVRSLDNQSGIFFDDLKTGGCELITGSLTDPGAVKKAVRDCHTVFHLAAAFRQMDVPNEHYWDVNVEGTRLLLDAATEAGVSKFVYCSTQGVHGHVESPPGDESSPIATADYYQLTKYEGEKIVNEYVQQGLDAVTLRPTAIYGPGDPARFLILYRLAKRKVFYMFGDGQTTYHPVYIDNLVDAFELAATTDGITGRTYIIGDEHYYPLNELVKLVAEAIDVPLRIIHLPFRPLWLAAAACEAVCKPLRISPPLFRRRVDWFRQVRAFKIDKAKQELGYRPKVGIQEGLRMTGEWYQQQGYL